MVCNSSHSHSNGKCNGKGGKGERNSHHYYSTPIYIYYIHMIEELRNGSSGDETSSYHSYHGNVVVIFIQLYGVFLIYSGGFGACYTHTHIYIYI